MIKLNVKDIIGNTIAMSTDDGKKLFNELYKNIKDSKKVELSFDGINMLISHFLNEAVGKLYEKFKNWDVLDQAIIYKDIDKDDLELLKDKVIPTAKNHFKNLEGSEKIEKSILDD